MTEAHRRLLQKAGTVPRQPRFVPPKTSPVLETVTRVLEGAAKPMRAREVRLCETLELGADPLLHCERLRQHDRPRIDAAAEDALPKLVRPRQALLERDRR